MNEVTFSAVFYWLFGDVIEAFLGFIFGLLHFIAVMLIGFVVIGLLLGLIVYLAYRWDNKNNRYKF